MPDPIADPEMPTMFVDVRCDERNPDSYVVKGWDVDTGRPMFTSPVGSGGISELALSPCHGLLLVIYNGDTGVIESGKVIRPDGDATADFAIGTDPGGGRRAVVEAMGARLATVLEDCQGDPERPCPLCDDTVPDDARIEPTECHRECVMAKIVGHYGRLVDPDFWIGNMKDPYGGLGPRGSALAVAKLVDEHGLYAVATRDFPQTEPAGGGDG